MGIQDKKTKSKKPSMMTTKRNELVFYCLMMALPIIHVIIFYFYINFRSFYLAFFKFDLAGNGFIFDGLNNFRQIIEEFKTTIWMRASIINSAKLFFWMLLFGTVFAILFSYYIYKKNFGSDLFKLILYMPQIISSIVIVIMYKFFVTLAIPELFEKVFNSNIEGLLSNPKTVKPTLIFYNVWISFGTQVLIYSSTMSGVSDSVIESAQLDGASPFRELISIVLPAIWPTFITFMLMRIVGLFTDQMNLFSFYGGSAEYSLYTFGYFLFNEVSKNEIIKYPYLSAFGLLLTVVAVPLVLSVKYLLEKFGPSVE